MPYKDKEKQRAYYREYQQREGRKAYKKEWDKQNRERLAEMQRARYKADPEKYRAYFRNHRINKKYGMSEHEYASMVVAFDGKCGVCRKEPSGTWHGDRKLNVDHCHGTGEVRGLLCNRCNRAIGLLGDTVDSLMAAVEYLKKYGKENQ